MAFNFGAFAGGLSQGMDQGMKIGKTIRDVIKEQKLQDLREQGMAEAEAQRAQAVSNAIKDGLPPQGQPTSGPVSTEAPKVAAPAADPSPEATSAPTSPASGMPAQVQALKPPGVVASADGNAGEAAAAANQSQMVQSTPSQVAAQQPSAPTPQAAAATGIATPSPAGRFTVNGQQFNTREDALAAAEKSTPSAQDFFMKSAVPKIANEYLVQGEPDKAKAWQDYADSHAGKRAIKDWAAAYTAPDLDTAVTRFGKYYTEHIDDGVDYKGHTLVTKADGTQVAMVTLKDKATGKESQVEMTREKMLALGGSNNPQHLFETEQAKQAAAEKLRYEAGIKTQDRREKLTDDLVMEQAKSKSAKELKAYEQDRLDQREGIKSRGEQERGLAMMGAKSDFAIAELRRFGYTPEEIKKMMPAMLGVGEHKKTTDPTERRAIIASELLKSDPTFSRSPQADQNKKIDDLMGVIYGPEDKPQAQPGGSTGPASAKPGPAPVISDKPMTYNKDLPVKYRKSDGKPFHVVDGKYVPIEGGVVPGAQAAQPAQPSPTPPAARGLPPSVSSQATVAQPQTAEQPSYEKYMEATKAKQDLLNAASRMSADRREAWLAPRLPEIEQQIAFHKRYLQAR